MASRLASAPREGSQAEVTHTPPQEPCNCRIGRTEELDRELDRGRLEVFAVGRGHGLRPPGGHVHIRHGQHASSSPYPPLFSN
jgi:hypothetical protein